MAAPGRQFDPDLAAILPLLKEAPQRIHFFQAVRLLRRCLANSRPSHRFARPSAEIVRFVANPSLAFPASEIQALDLGELDPESKTMEIVPKMMVNFMGLCSPVGTLPTPYTELLHRRDRTRIGSGREEKYDSALRDFLDIFNHRLISLFYAAWEKYRFFIKYERGESDELTPVLLSLIGLGTKDLRERHVVPDEALAFYSGLFAQHPRTVQGLHQILSDYFGVTVYVEQFAGKWIKLPAASQTRVGQEEPVITQLGLGAVIGDEIWDQQSTVRIRLGPLPKSMYLDFLPPRTHEKHEASGALCQETQTVAPKMRAYDALKSLLRFYSNDQIDFEVQLILQDEDTPEPELHEDAQELMLGWTTWMKKTAAPYRNELQPEEAVLQM